MAIIRIGSQEVSLDISEELADFDWGYNAKWTADKVIAASPFRDDSTPSFFVNLDGEYAGTWSDSGAYDDEYKSGNFTKLLAYLRSESIEETERYLLESYGILYEDAEDIRLPEIRLTRRVSTVLIPTETVTTAISPYLSKRGISADAQRLYGVGYGESHEGFTAIPWHSPQGRLANIKYRSTSGKTFFFEKNATPVKTLVYGLDIINSERKDTAVLCEGEIDAMSWATAGIAAIAVGGASISAEQVDAIKRSSIRRLLVGGDNDPVGARLNAEILRRLRGYVELYEVDYGDCKDANEYLRAHGVEGLRMVYEQALSIKRVNCLQLRDNKVILQ